MSETKLNLPHKLFAALERLIRDTRVNDLDLQWKVTTGTPDFSLTAKIHSLDFTIPVEVAETPVTIETAVVEIVYCFTHPSVQEASLQALTTRVHDENVELISAVAVISEPLQFTTTTRIFDFFQQYHIHAGRLSSTFSSASGSSPPMVKHIDLGVIKPQVHALPVSKLKIAARIKENLTFFNRLKVQKKPVILSFLSEKQQLVYWKRAVTQTRREARLLHMIGVYTGIPYDCIENIKVNASEKSLNYNFKTRTFGRGVELKDIALFSDMTTDKILMVVK